MAITSLEEKENRKLWVPIRGGNRGGWSLFSWQKVRDMPYKDREMYLGNSVTVGVLDKGGKWRKRDWFMKTNKKYDSQNLTAEQSEAMKRDYERMNAALGITQQQDEQQLTEQEMRELMKKIQAKKQGYVEPTAPDAIGLGFDKAKVQIRARPSARMDNPHRLEAIDQFGPEFKEQKEQKNQKKQRKEKKQKKQKKQKKKKDKQRKHNKHREESEQKQEKKKKKQKHHKREKDQKQVGKRDRSRSEQKRRKRRHSSSQSRSSSD